LVVLNSSNAEQMMRNCNKSIPEIFRYGSQRDYVGVIVAEGKLKLRNITILEFKWIDVSK
jgi:hypothetical protein